MTTPSSWESITFALLAQVEREIEAITGNLALLSRQRDSLTEAMHIYKDRVSTATATDTPKMLGLSHEEVQGKSQRTILHLLAAKNNGVLVVREAVRLMGEAGVFASMKNATQMVYGVLRKTPTFKRIAPGVYSLVGNGEESALQLTTSVNTTGLVDRVRQLRNQHPDATRRIATGMLLAEGYNFGDRKPEFAVSAAWMNLERQRKRANKSV